MVFNGDQKRCYKISSVWLASLIIQGVELKDGVSRVCIERPSVKALAVKAFSGKSVSMTSNHERWSRRST